jgi:Zn-finger nucleic acid-binding protein/predicted nucleic acid-binding Zn ribbon protein
MAESLHCPNCGGAVESDKTQCEYCKARLKTVACPECLGLMFLGSKFCDSCGREAKSVEVIDDAKSVDCPRCKRKLESICSNKENQAAVLNLVSSRSADAAAQPAISYVPCPDCKQLMNRSNFARSSGVIVDLCKQHGVWFDRGELPKIIDFVDKGGLSRSREKEKIDLEDARDNLRDEQRKLALMERRTGSDGYTRDDDNSWGGVIAALFDL